jgi:Nuclear transport factor 2 (NTF2) domain
MVESFGYRDCAVILSSVDCMESTAGGILIQVLGELSNDGAASQKFAQTFFLASVPPSGYFVLNNIFRFLKDDLDSDYDDEEPDSGNEMDTTLSAIPQYASVTEHLSNGYHHEAAPVPVDQEDLDSAPLAISVVPSLSTVETVTPNHLTESLETKVPDEPRPSPQFDSGFSENTATHDSTDEPTADTGEDVRPKPEPLSEEEPQQTAAPPAVPPSPVVKTWATMAASSPEKWGDRGSEAKVLSTQPVSRPKPAVAQPGPRKTSAKTTTPGILHLASHADPPQKNQNLPLDTLNMSTETFKNQH